MKTRNRILVGLLIVAMLSTMFVIDLMVGSADLSVSTILKALVCPKSTDPIAVTIVRTFRLPVAVMAMLAGMLLGLSGAVMQTLLANPLASPYTLGVSSAASFGAAVGILFAPSIPFLAVSATVPSCAFVFAMMTALLLYGIVRWRGGTGSTVILAGILVLHLFNALVAFLQYVANDEQLSAIVFWMFGSLQNASWTQIALVAGTAAVTVPWIFARAWPLTVLSGGDAAADALGLNVGRLRLEMLLAISAATGIVVSCVGAIGFVGLVAPHLARRTVGEDHRFYLPGSALIGALLLILADLVSRRLAPGAVFPIGVATAFVGIPFFAVLLFTRKGRV